MLTVIKVENLSKQYRLGQVGTGTLKDDLKRWWALARGKEDPFLKIGETNIRNEKQKGDYIWALRDINFDVKQGEVLGIIGKNGAGKSTLLKILSQVTLPTTGSVRVKGKIASLLEVGTGFHPELTGRENIFLNGAILGMTKTEIRKKFDEIVEFSGVEKYIDTPVKRYSSGMYVRLAFAVAAHLEPEILIIDEVLAVGDAEFQKKCLGKMKDVSVQGRTVLFVSHNMNAVRHLCTRSILLSNGEKICEGDTKEVINTYINSSKQVDLHTKQLITYNENRRNTGHIRFTSIKVHDTENRPKYDFMMDETICFTFSFEAIENLNGISIFIGLRSGTSREIITSIRRNVSNEKIASATTGTFTVELKDTNLRIGEYPLYFQISESSPLSRKFEVIDDATLPLVITANSEMNIDGYNPYTPIGYFSLPSARVVKCNIYTPD